MAENLSNQLKEKLGENESKTVESLFDFKEVIDELSSISTCNPDQAESIVSKELNITYFIEQLIKINNMHISNEEKKNMIQTLLPNVDIKYLLEEIENEINKVGPLLDEKGKEVAKGVQEKAVEVRNNFSRLIDGNIENEEEKVEDATKRKQQILDSEKERAKNETQMVVHENTGFMANFRKMKEKGHGFFKSVFGAMKLTREAGNTPVENPEISKLEEELKSVESQIQASKENVKELKAQKKVLENQIISEAEKTMKEVKGKIKESKEPIPETQITEERAISLVERIEEFRENRRDAKYEKKVGKLNAKIEARTEQISELTAEKNGYMAEREGSIEVDPQEVLNRFGESEGKSSEEIVEEIRKENTRSDKEITEDMDIVMDVITENQIKRYDLGRKVQHENEMYQSKIQEKHNEKVSKLQERIDALTKDIEGITGEINRYKEERENGETKKSVEKNLDIDLELKTKMQQERYELLRKLKQENERYASRNEGMDR